MSSAMSGYRPGDSALTVNGERVTLRLTLGALAELEERLGGGDFSELTRRLEKTGVGNLLVLLEALSAGGGRRLSVHDLESADIDLAEAARAVAKAFAALAPAKEGPHPSRFARRPLPPGEVKKGAPFPSPLPEGEVARSAGEGNLASPAGRGRAEGAGEGLLP